MGEEESMDCEEALGVEVVLFDALKDQPKVVSKLFDSKKRAELEKRV